MSKISPMSNNSGNSDPIKEKSFCSGNRELDFKKIKIGGKILTLLIRKRFKKFYKKKISLLRKNLKMQKTAYEEERRKQEENSIKARVRINTELGFIDSTDDSIFNQKIKDAQATQFTNKMINQDTINSSLKLKLEDVNITRHDI